MLRGFVMLIFLIFCVELKFFIGIWLHFWVLDRLSFVEEPVASTSYCGLSELRIPKLESNEFFRKRTQ